MTALPDVVSVQIVYNCVGSYKQQHAVPSTAGRIRCLKEEYGQTNRINSASKDQGSDQCCQNRETAEMQYTERDFKMYYPNPGQFFYVVSRLSTHWEFYSA